MWGFLGLSPDLLPFSRLDGAGKGGQGATPSDSPPRVLPSAWCWLPAPTCLALGAIKG